MYICIYVYIYIYICINVYMHIYFSFGKPNSLHTDKYSMREYTEFFWSLSSRALTEYGDILCKSPYSVRIREITYQKKFRIWKLFT